MCESARSRTYARLLLTLCVTFPPLCVGAEPAPIPESAMTKTQQAAAWKAVETCQIATRLTLNDPSSAEFPAPSRSYRALDGRAYVAQVHVRARNAFNATRLAVMECRVDAKSGKLLSIHQIR